MIDAVTEGVNAGLTPQQSLDEIHTYMGWTENRENLYVKSNEQVINELLDFLRTLHTQYQRDSAWIEVSYYYDAHYNKVNNIEQAEYVVFILYR